MTTRMPTMADVAERAGVSRSLVSLVMRGAPGPSAASRELVLAAAAEIDFRPNAAAQLLRRRTTNTLGVLFSALNHFESRFVETLLERAPAAGLNVHLAPVTPSRTTDTAVAELLTHRVEALACYNPDPRSTVLQRALGLMPVVWLGERSGDPRADAVRADDEQGLSLAVEHLAGLGHRRIVYAGGRGGRVGPDRAAAYRAAMRGAGLAREIDVVDGDFGEEDGAAAARELLRRDVLPTAVIGCSDHSAAGVRAVLALAGVDVPGTVSVVGYDDSDVAALSYNDLTAVRQDVGITVDTTLERVRTRLADPREGARDLPTTTTLTVRSSTGPARAH